MTRRAPTHVIAAIVACLAAPVVLAQSERINIRQAPRPDQTVRMTMNQSLDMDVTIEGGPAPAGAGPLKMAMRMTAQMTQKTGSARPDGSYDSELTYGQTRMTLEMNGVPLPAPAPANQVEGKTMTVTYDVNGQITDVKDLPGGGGAVDAVRQMLRAFSANIPVSTVGVGETVTTPLEFSIPLPIGGGTPMKISGETKMTLVSVDTDGGTRLARFASTSDGKISADQPGPGGGGMSIDMPLGGDGTTVIDLEKGVLRSGEMRTRFNGKVSNSGNAAPALPGISMQGTMTVTVASN